MAEAAKKAAPKRKTTARKAPAKRKVAAKKTTAKKAAPSKAATMQNRVTEAGRSAFLASLGFYGMAFDQVQDQVKNVEKEVVARRKKVEKELTSRRKQADKLYADMVKRGEKVEKKAKTALDDIDLPKLELPKLEAQLNKAKARFEELKESVGFKAAA